MDNVIIARSLFGTSLGFHIIFATLGVGIPLMILAAEILYQFNRDTHWCGRCRSPKEPSLGLKTLIFSCI